MGGLNEWTVPGKPGDANGEERAFHNRGKRRFVPARFPYGQQWHRRALTGLAWRILNT